MKLFTEIGWGNATFISTETEWPDGTETRQPGFVKMHIVQVYIRVWIGRKVLLLSTSEGLKITSKYRSGFKLLIGIANS